MSGATDTLMSGVLIDDCQELWHFLIVCRKIHIFHFQELVRLKKNLTKKYDVSILKVEV